MINNLKPNQIFVFGSNTEGLHYGGAAKQALKWGAVMGKPFGHYGQTFAIPTICGLTWQPLDILTISDWVTAFIMYAEDNKEYEFLVTAIGCGIAGFSPNDIAPLFEYAHLYLPNVKLPEDFNN